MGYQFIFDLTKCIGCGACEMACVKKHKFFYGNRQLREIEINSGEKKQKGYLSVSCHHCGNPQCMQACPEGLYYKNSEEVVLHQERNCKGCKKCIEACPYEGPRYHTIMGVVTKCDFCIDHIEQGRDPRCVQACPTMALTYRKGGERKGQAEEREKKSRTIVLEKEELTAPNLYLVQPKSLMTAKNEVSNDGRRI